MKLVADHSFHIGKQHLRQGKPCQDYALSGMLHDETAYAIISDGCSSGGMTDFGSRLISLATLRALEQQTAGGNLQLQKVDDFRNQFLESYQSKLQLPPADLLSTNLWAVVNEEKVTVGLTGDGTVALQYEYGLMIISYEWQQNKPYYPIYRLSGSDTAFRNTHQATISPLIKKITTVHQTTETVSQPLDLDTGMQEQLLSYPLIHGEFGQLHSVALFSDGVEQVDQFTPVEVVRFLLSFKSTSGQFAVRRMNRFLQESKKIGHGPLDDIAYAVVHLITEKE